MSPPVEARGSLHRGFVGDRTARFLLVSLPQLAELTRQRHGLGPAELQAMWQEDNGAEISCHFCNIHYQVSGDRLAELCAMHARGEA